MKLLRDIPRVPVALSDSPKKISKENWDDTSNLKKVGLGSMVNTTNSTTTWSRKNAIY